MTSGAYGFVCETLKKHTMRDILHGKISLDLSNPGFFQGVDTQSLITLNFASQLK